MDNRSITIMKRAVSVVKHFAPNINTGLLAVLIFLGKRTIERYDHQFDALDAGQQIQDGRIGSLQQDVTSLKDWRVEASAQMHGVQRQVNDNRSSIIGISTRVAHIEDRDGITASDNISLYTNSAVKVK